MMLTAVALILIVTCEVALREDHKVPIEEIYPLDMASHSVDDKYNGCSSKMAHLVQTHYLKKEITANISGFGGAWEQAAKNNTKGKDNLKSNHLIAITVYTGCKVHREFNKDVRTGKQAYKTQAFRWYSLYFWLTEALQSLKKMQQNCKSTYRGTRGSYKKNNVLNKEIRFGLFASSSLDRNETKKFGNRSCFEIYTCYGADVSKYSLYPDEKEVLIPPYEKFIITAIRNDQKGDWCKTVYTLKSSGIQSNLNCKVAAVDPPKYHRSHSLSPHDIRGGKNTSSLAFLSTSQTRFLMKSKHGNRKESRLRMLHVKQRKDSKIFHQYRMKSKMSYFMRK